MQLEGTQSNRLALGARVAVHRSGGQVLWRRAQTDSSYLSASDVRVHFGLDSAPEIEAVVVDWPGPNGRSEQFSGIVAVRVVRLKEGAGSVVTRLSSPHPPPVPGR